MHNLWNMKLLSFWHTCQQDSYTSEEHKQMGWQLQKEDLCLSNYTRSHIKRGLHTQNYQISLQKATISKTGWNIIHNRPNILFQWCSLRMTLLFKEFQYWNSVKIMYHAYNVWVRLFLPLEEYSHLVSNWFNSVWKDLRKRKIGFWRYFLGFLYLYIYCYCYYLI